MCHHFVSSFRILTLYHQNVSSLCIIILYLHLVSSFGIIEMYLQFVIPSIAHHLARKYLRTNWPPLAKATLVEVKFKLRTFLWIFTYNKILSWSKKGLKIRAAGQETVVCRLHYWVLVKATPNTPAHFPLFRCCNISLKRVGYLSARCARSTCLRQGGNRNQNVHYAVLTMHGSFRVLKPNLTIMIKPKMGMRS